MKLDGHERERAPSGWLPPAGDLRDAGLCLRLAGDETSPVLLLLHGLAGSHRYFGAQFDALTEQARLVVPDLLGFGASPHPDDSDYGPGAHADAVLDALERVGARPPLYVGAHSVGTLVALQIALRRPGWVRAIVTFGPPLYRTPEQARAHIARLGPWVRFLAMDTPWARAACGWMCRHRPLAARLAEWMRPDLPGPIARDAIHHTWSSYSGTLRNLVLGAQQGQDLVRTRVPLHLIAGGQDPVVDLEFLRELARDHAHVQLEEWPGGHDLPLRQPERCVATLRSVMRRP